MSIFASLNNLNKGYSTCYKNYNKIMANWPKSYILLHKKRPAQDIITGTLGRSKIQNILVVPAYHWAKLLIKVQFF